MLLRRLKEYAEAGHVAALAPPGYLTTPIRYVVELDGAGRLLGVADLARGKGARERRGQSMLAPATLRTAGVKPKLLADNGEYALGIARDREKQERADRAHRAFADLVRECAAATGEPAVLAVQTFLDGGADPGAQLPDDYDPGLAVTFRAGGVLPIDLPAVREFWAGHGAAEGSAQCLVCGESRPPMKVLAYRWKGIPGGQTSGLALISANAPAFESHGLEQSLNAPTCAECGELFSKAANDLLAREGTRLRIGPLACIAWAREPTGLEVAALLNDPPPGVAALLADPRGGARGSAWPDGVPVYAAALSASGSRVVLRAWHEHPLGAVRRHLARYFRLQRIVGPDGADALPLGLAALAGATARELGAVAPASARALFDVALGGGPVPLGLLHDAIRRCRAEGGVRRPQAALIKMALLGGRAGWGDGSMEDRTYVRLDEQSREPAYLCGRLLAVLEAIQRAALGNIASSLVERHYLTASSAPAATFGKLLRGAQAHLDALRRDRPSARGALQRRLEEVQAGLAAFPRTLTLTEQGLFALGYYHQRAADRAAARAGRTGARPSGETNDPAAPTVAERSGTP